MLYLLVTLLTVGLRHVYLYLAPPTTVWGQWFSDVLGYAAFVLIAYALIVALRRSGVIFNFILPRIVPAIMAQVVVLGFGYFRSLPSFLNIMLRVQLTLITALGLALLVQTALAHAPAVRERMAAAWRSLTGTPAEYALGFRGQPPFTETTSTPHRLTPDIERIFHGRSRWLPNWLTGGEPLQAVLLGVVMTVAGLGLIYILDFSVHWTEVIFTAALIALHSVTAYPDRKVPIRFRRRRWITISLTLAVLLGLILLVTILTDGPIAAATAGVGGVLASALFAFEDPPATRGAGPGRAGAHWLYPAFLLVLGLIASR